MVKRLLVLNGLAVLGAVVNHSSGWGFTAMFWWTGRYLAGASSPDFSQMGSFPYYALRAAEQLIIGFSIPSFLFVSGFFVAFATGRQRENIAWSVVGSRIKTLAFPYVIWSLAIFVGRGIEGSIDTAYGYFQQLLTGRAAAPYYYVPLLAQFFVLSPLIVPMIRRRWKLALVVAGVIQVVAHLARYPVILGWNLTMADWIVEFSPGFTVPQTVFWFVFGVFAGFNLPILKKRLFRYRYILPCVTALIAAAGFLEWELLYRLSGAAWLSPEVTLLDSLYAGGFILSFLALGDANIPGGTILGELGTRSFGIYLAHAPVLELVSRTVYRAAPWILGHQALLQPLLIGSGILVPVFLMTLLNRSPMRGAYRYIFG